MPSPYNITNIPAPRVDFIDPRTGLMAREWYRFFFNLFNLTGAGTTDTSLADLQVGPPAINDLLGELGITYDQAQLAAMMAQYEQSVRDLQNQLETAPAQPQLGTLASVNADNVRLLGFSTNPSPPVPNPAPTGTLYWDGNNTLGLQMDQGVLAKIGQSQFTYVKASATITKGQLVKHTGAVGGSGVITVAPTSVSMTDANQIVGVAAEDIALNGFGFIQDSGSLRGFDTTGTSVGETWVDGDPLYYNPAYVGALTKTKPSAPNLKSYVGEVINAGAGGSGSISIRLQPGSVLGGTDSNVQFGTLADKDLIQYDSTAQYWKNVAPSSISIGTATNLAGGAVGSVPYQSGAGATTFLPIGTATQVLKVNAGATAPEWVSGAALSKVDDTNVTLTLGGSPTTSLLAATSLTLGWTGTLAVSRGGTGTGTAFTAGSIIFAGASGVYSQDNANLFWDDASNRLGIGTVTPGSTLDVAGSFNVTGNAVLNTATVTSITASAGSAGAPSYTFSTSITTGLFSPSAGVMAFSIAGSEKIRFTSAGQIGVGVSTPTGMVQTSQPNSVTPGVLISGKDFSNIYNDPNAGVILAVGHNASGNRQLWVGDSDKIGSSVNSFFRMGGGNGQIAYLDAVRCDGGLQMPFTLGTQFSDIAIGGNYAWAYNVTLPGKLSVYPASAGQIGLVVQGYASQYVNLFEARNSASTTLTTIDANGKVLIGTSSAGFSTRENQKLAVVTTGGSVYGGASFTCYAGATQDISPLVDLQKSRGTTDGDYTSVISGDVLGYLIWRGADGTAFRNSAGIRAEVDGTPGPSDMPGRLVFLTSPDGTNTLTERMRITNSGNVGIGSASPAAKLDVTGAAIISTSVTSPLLIGGTGTTSTLTLRSTSGVGTTGADIVFQVGNNGATEAMRALNSGVVCVGTATATNNARLNQKLAVVSTGAGNYGGAAITTYGGTTADVSSVIDLVRSRGTTDGSFTAVASGDRLGYIVWRGADGSAFQNAASIRAEVDGTPGAGSMPGRLILMTTPSGSAASLERLRIDAAGNVLVTGVGGLGYGTGSGGAVTQATSRTTGVTLNKTNGAITLVSAAGTTTWQTFTVTNSTVAATDTIIVNQKSGTDLYQIFVTNVAAGSFKITFATTGGTTTEQPVFNFAVIKAVTA